MTARFTKIEIPFFHIIQYVALHMEVRAFMTIVHTHTNLRRCIVEVRATHLGQP